MRRGFFRLWVVISVLWVAAWIGVGVTLGLMVTPAHEIAAPVDRASLGLPPDASDMDMAIAMLRAATRHERPRAQLVPAAFDPVGALKIAGIAASAPLLLLAIGWAFAGFSGAMRRNNDSWSPGQS